MLRLPHGVVTTRSAASIPAVARRRTGELGDLLMRAARTQRRRWREVLAPVGPLPAPGARAGASSARAGRRPAVRPRRGAAHRAAVGDRGRRRAAGARPGRADTRPGDRRAVILRPTDEGRRIRAEIDRRPHGRLRPSCSPASRADDREHADPAAPDPRRLRTVGALGAEHVPRATATGGRCSAFRVRAQQLDRALGLAGRHRRPRHRRPGHRHRRRAVGPGPPRRRRGRPTTHLATGVDVRGAPHVYRRATSPASPPPPRRSPTPTPASGSSTPRKPLKAAGIPNLEASTPSPDAMRSIVTAPMVKGEMSTRLTAVLDEPYLRFCVPCDAIHTYEQPFRLAALRAGLELEPGTSPPVLRPVPGLAPAPTRCPTASTSSAATCACSGPATPKLVAGYLDAPVKDVRGALAGGRRRGGRGRRAPLGARRRRSTGSPRARRRAPACSARSTSSCRPATGRCWSATRRARRPCGGRSAGRAAVLVDGEIVGTWRARKSGSALTVTLDLWSAPTGARAGGSPSRRTGSPPSAGSG